MVVRKVRKCGCGFKEGEKTVNVFVWEVGKCEGALKEGIKFLCLQEGWKKCVCDCLWKVF